MESTTSFLRTTSPTYFHWKRLVSGLIAAVLRETLVLNAVSSPLTNEGDKTGQLPKYDETLNPVQLRNIISFKEQISNFV